MCTARILALPLVLSYQVTWEAKSWNPWRAGGDVFCDQYSIYLVPYGWSYSLYFLKGHIGEILYLLYSYMTWRLGNKKLTPLKGWWRSLRPVLDLIRTLRLAFHGTFIHIRGLFVHFVLAYDLAIFEQKVDTLGWLMVTFFATSTWSNKGLTVGNPCTFCKVILGKFCTICTHIWHGMAWHGNKKLTPLMGWWHSMQAVLDRIRALRLVIIVLSERSYWGNSVPFELLICEYSHIRQLWSKKLTPLKGCGHFLCSLCLISLGPNECNCIGFSSSSNSNHLQL